MADSKISALPLASALAGTEVAPIVQAAGTVQVTVSAIAALFPSIVSAPAGSVIWGVSATSFSATAAGSTGQLLQSNGAGAPTFTSNPTYTHLISSGNTPTIVVGAGAGTGATVTLTGKDGCGTITLNTGTTPTASAVAFTLTFAQTWGAAPVVTFSPANANAAALSSTTAVSIGTVTTTTFTFVAGSGGLAASTTYLWTYRCGQ